jgi:hypothetical protein
MSNVISLDAVRHAKLRGQYKGRHGQPHLADVTLLDPATARAVSAQLEYGKCRCHALCRCRE